MPADRRIIVKLETLGYRDPDLQGEYVPGPIIDYPLWATETSAGSIDTLVTGRGLVVRRTINFTVRWFKALAETQINFVEVIGSDGFTYNATNIEASDERRRFVTIEAVAEPGDQV